VNIHTIDRNATLSRRILSMSGFSLLLAALFLPLFIAQAPAQTWPARPVSVIVPFTAGTTSDVIARGVAVSHRTIFPPCFSWFERCRQDSNTDVPHSPDVAFPGGHRSFRKFNASRRAQLALFYDALVQL
jgi:hypothetical protein